MSEKRTLLQKILLGLLAAITVLFAVLTGVNRSQPLVQWGGSLLRPAEEGNAAVYTSAVYGEDIAIRVWPDGADTVVEFTVGSRLRQTGRVTWPEGTISREHGGDVPRIEVFLDGASIFSGGCDRDSGALYLEDGSREIGPLVHYFTSYSSSWDNFALEASDVVRFAMGPDTVCRGSWTAYALGVFFSLLAATMVAFPRFFFRFQHALSVRDPEPTDFYLAMQKVNWVLLTAVALGVYIWGATVIE